MPIGPSGLMEFVRFDAGEALLSGPDAATGQDRDLLSLARWVEQVIGSVNGPRSF